MSVKKMATNNSDFLSGEDFDAIMAALEEDEDFERELCTVTEDVSSVFLSFAPAKTGLPPTFIFACLLFQSGTFACGA